jgi:hypothetical protein
MMLVWIDRFTTLNGVIIISGWSSLYSPGAALSILYDGVEIKTLAAPIDRRDVFAAYGGDAAGWGFRVCAISPSERPVSADIGLRFSDGTVIGDLSQRRDESFNRPYELMEEFFAEVNSRGGTVVEIGSRARSGNTARGRFTPAVKYIGVDVSGGPNVDVIGDAHHLSELGLGLVDYVFSISTFEHFMMPWKVCLEINKILRIGGKVLSHSHQTWPIHDEPWDYFRFSTDAWKGLYNAHTGFSGLRCSRGEPVAISFQFNPGAPFDHIDHSPGWGLSVCIAEKIASPRVEWTGRMDDLEKIQYNH